MNPKQPRTGTFAYLVWDDEAIYYAGSMTDAELRSFGTKRNDTPLGGRRLRALLEAQGRPARVLRVSGEPRAVVFEMAFPKRPEGPVDFAAGPLSGQHAPW